MLRLPKDDRGSLARDMTLRRPVEGDGDGRKMGKRGRRWGRWPCWGPAGALASAWGMGGGAAKIVPWMPLQLHHSGRGEVDQELVARVGVQLQKEGTQSQA